MTDNTVSDQRHLPNPERCRTRFLGATLTFSDCLVINPEACKHALRYGFGVFCRHPDRRNFEKKGLP
jgi:hypothetical protein